MESNYNLLETLPPEILINNIFTNLSIYKLLNLCQSSDNINNICLDDNTWYILTKNKYADFEINKTDDITWYDYYTMLSTVNLQIIYNGDYIGDTILDKSQDIEIGYIYDDIRYKLGDTNFYFILSYGRVPLMVYNNNKFLFEDTEKKMEYPITHVLVITDPIVIKKIQNLNISLGRINKKTVLRYDALRENYYNMFSKWRKILLKIMDTCLYSPKGNPPIYGVSDENMDNIFIISYLDSRHKRTPGGMIRSEYSKPILICNNRNNIADLINIYHNLYTKDFRENNIQSLDELCEMILNKLKEYNHVIVYPILKDELIW
ncbi:F-box domain-containing protein [Orpheovirus IHUMI-LCC2]|uniref:F-box domain-containing protein n=1 Tax=Orpheovirus IHUMI-LCC2 TaxID=2023057 RepID=A0A2I2L391_9VIRU|nr:F-box domain-containing protein [Orpheovirus IHUMI-LCC2]SNW62015.1 F-box domain-containing protein [Orpheovirus IHUMI-LCC2]